MEVFAQFGLAGLAIGAVMGALSFAKHVYDNRKGNGNGKLVCPNRVDDLWPAIRALDSSVRRTERASNAAQEGIKRLLDDHSGQMETLVELQTRSTVALESLVNMQSQDHG